MARYRDTDSTCAPVVPDVPTSTAYSAAAHRQERILADGLASPDSVGFRKTGKCRFAPHVAVRVTRFFAARASPVSSRCSRAFTTAADPLRLSTGRAA
jgi:hypothetical protein